jgi:hypothetical protein
MDGNTLRETLEAIIPEAEMQALARELGVVERESKRDLAMFVRAMILAAGTARGGVQADAMRRYLDMLAPTSPRRVSRQAFYRWFDDKLEVFMERLAEKALLYAQSQELDVPAPLDIACDWHIVDSETVKVRDSLKGQFRGTGDYAAFKVHKRYSVGCGAPVWYHISEAREHDSKHLDIDESWRGRGLLVDLGYVSLDRLAACNRHGVFLVVRLKEGWKPKVQNIGQGTVDKTFLPGADFQALLADGTIPLDGKVVDLDVEVGCGNVRVPIRLCGVPTPKGYCFYLTNLPRTVTASQVCDIYRVRWEIELSNKVDKSVHRLDESAAERPCSIMTMVHASLIATIITSLLAHKHNLTTRPARRGAPRTAAPIHTNLLARAFAASALGIARAFELTGDEATREWNRIADYLTHVSLDPNWKQRPSVLDQMRGWKDQTKARRRA